MKAPRQAREDAAGDPSAPAIADKADARLPSALSIAGLDPSGGAGLTADLRSFSAAGVWGAAACAALTVQSTRGVRAVHAVETQLLIAQIEELLGDLRVTAIKTGALGSAANVGALSALLAARPAIPAIVDPVMLPSQRTAQGARLDGPGSLAALRGLAARAFLLTPNLPEAAALLGCSSNDLGDPSAAAIALLELGAHAVLLKGGHGSGAQSIDWLALREGPERLVPIAGPRRDTPPIHGTGCTLASLIAGRLALRPAPGALPSTDALIAAVRWARARLDEAICGALTIGHGQLVLAPARVDPA
jgi:hydroxymethylpyrimidine/phosphomethylpyrimidine kinase